MPENFIFPAGSAQTETPFWINFAAIPYSKLKAYENRVRRPRAYINLATVSVSLPFSGSFESSNSLNYTNDANAVIEQTMGNATTVEDVRLQGLAARLEEDVETGTVGVNQTPVESTKNSANKYMSVDMMDMMFLGGSFREYSMEFNLICKSAQDSHLGGAVCSIFSSQCWPLLNPRSSSNSGNAKLMHPDLWVIWLSKLPFQNSMANDLDNTWVDGIGPNLCVLTDVITKRVGGENNRILAISNSDVPTSRRNPGMSDERPPLPLQYKLALAFVELEVSIQNPNEYQVLNRSRALSTLLGLDDTTSSEAV